MACVNSLIKGVRGSCLALKKVGGLNKRIYLGTVDDVATVTFGANDANSITGFTFKDPITSTGTGITLANPGVATVASTASLTTGQVITITANTGATLVGGLTIVGQSFTITVINGTTFSLGATTTGAASTGFTFTYATKGLTQWTGKKDKNSAGVEIEVGENVNIRNQTVTPIVYYETAEELSYLDALIDQEQVFAIVETVAGSLEVFGINKVNFGSFGLKASALTLVSGVLLNDSTAGTVTLTGGLTNLQLQYNPSVSLATNIAALDALSIDPAP
jgi:hypothetical protein